MRPEPLKLAGIVTVLFGGVSCLGATAMAAELPVAATGRIVPLAYPDTDASVDASSFDASSFDASGRAVRGDGGASYLPFAVQLTDDAAGRGIAHGTRVAHVPRVASSAPDVLNSALDDSHNGALSTASAALYAASARGASAQAVRRVAPDESFDVAFDAASSPTPGQASDGSSNEVDVTQVVTQAPHAPVVAAEVLVDAMPQPDAPVQRADDATVETRADASFAPDAQTVRPQTSPESPGLADAAPPTAPDTADYVDTARSADASINVNSTARADVIVATGASAASVRADSAELARTPAAEDGASAQAFAKPPAGAQTHRVDPASASSHSPGDATLTRIAAQNTAQNTERISVQVAAIAPPSTPEARPAALPDVSHLSTSAVARTISSVVPKPVEVTAIASPVPTVSFDRPAPHLTGAALSLNGGVGLDAGMRTAPANAAAQPPQPTLQKRAAIAATSMTSTTSTTATQKAATSATQQPATTATTATTARQESHSTLSTATQASVDVRTSGDMQAPLQARTATDDSGGWADEKVALVSSDKLDTMRGGFEMPSGLIVSFGISREAFVNGTLVSSAAVNIPDVAHMTAQQAQMLVAVNAAGLVQNGSGNVVQGSLPQLGGTTIQNTLSNQQIQALTTISATVNSLAMFQGLNIAHTLDSALTSAIHPR